MMMMMMIIIIITDDDESDSWKTYFPEEEEEDGPISSSKGFGRLPCISCYIWRHRPPFYSLAFSSQKWVERWNKRGGGDLSFLFFINNSSVQRRRRRRYRVKEHGLSFLPHCQKRWHLPTTADGDYYRPPPVGPSSSFLACFPLSHFKEMKLLFDLS